MIEPIIALLRFLQAAVHVEVAPDAQLTVLLVGAIGAAAVALVVTAWQRVPALVAADPSGASARLRPTADLGRLNSQSDPDAAGRPRPRAPGHGIQAA